MKHALALGFPLAVGIAALAACAHAGGSAGGNAAAYEFKQPPVNALGVRGLAELRGKPVLVDFWGTHCPPCISHAVPHALELQRKYGAALQVIFVESQGSSREQYEAFAWSRGWMGTAAMWTEERPIPVLGNMLPETALIGVDGRVLVQGHPVTVGAELEEALAAEVQKVKQAPDGTSPALAKAWSTFASGDIAGALAQCDALGTGDAGLVRERFVASTQARIARAQWLADNGYVAEAEQSAAALAKDVKGCTDLEPPVAALNARLAAPEFAREREAAKAIAAFLEQAARKAPFDDANVKQAKALAQQYADTKAGARAAHFALLARVQAPQ